MGCYSKNTQKLATLYQRHFFRLTRSAKILNSLTNILFFIVHNKVTVSFLVLYENMWGSGIPIALVALLSPYGAVTWVTITSLIAMGAWQRG